MISFHIEVIRDREDRRKELLKRSAQPFSIPNGLLLACLLAPPRRCHALAGDEDAAEMGAVVEAAGECDVGDGPICRLWRGQQPGGAVHALVPEKSHDGFAALREDLLQEARR